jgi:hypothetical protein
MRKLTAALFTALATAAVAPVLSASVANADICAGAHGRHFAAGGCTDVVGGVASALSSPRRTFRMSRARPPCYTVEGVAYTPPGDPR